MTKIPAPDAPIEEHIAELRNLLFDMGDPHGPISLATATLDWLKACAENPKLSPLVDLARDQVRYSRSLKR